MDIIYEIDSIVEIKYLNKEKIMKLIESYEWLLKKVNGIQNSDFEILIKQNLGILSYYKTTAHLKSEFPVTFFG